MSTDNVVHASFQIIHGKKKMTFKYFTCDKREGPQGHWPSDVLTGRGPSLVGAAPLTLQQTNQKPCNIITHTDQLKTMLYNNIYIYIRPIKNHVT